MLLAAETGAHEMRAHELRGGPSLRLYSYSYIYIYIYIYIYTLSRMNLLLIIPVRLLLLCSSLWYSVERGREAGRERESL